jgi:hypothetical protein
MENNQVIRATCVQCGEEMEGLCDIEKCVPVCARKECPNFGILQLGTEKMIYFLNNGNTKTNNGRSTRNGRKDG